MLFHSRPLDAYRQTSFNSASKGTFMADAYGLYWKITLGQGIPIILPLDGDNAFKEIPRDALQIPVHDGLQPFGNQPCIEIPADELRIAIGTISKKPVPAPWHAGTLGLTSQNKFVVCIEAAIGNEPRGYLVELPTGTLYDTDGWDVAHWNSIAWVNHWALESTDSITGKSEVLCTYDGRSLAGAA